MEDGLKINDKLVFEIYKIRGDNCEKYCFPLRMFLGHNGLYPDHPLKGKTFIQNETGAKFTVDDVYVHWYKGWYFMALARNEHNSHTSISWDINTQDDWHDFTLQNYTLQE